MKFFTKICGLLLLFGLGNASPFDYDLHLTSFPGTNSRTMICLHGYGSNYQLAEHLKDLYPIEATLISFNFPDHDLLERDYDPHRATFGTMKELLPAIYVLKKCVIEEGIEAIDLYGYSAGGAVAINLLGVLNGTTHDEELKQFGLTERDKEKLLSALQKGAIILDVPLKSVEEIIDHRGTSPELEILAQNYRKNHFRPIDSVESLRGLSLDIIVHFQDPDEITFNRDDSLFVERIKEANKQGTTSVVIGSEGGHVAPHESLWEFYFRKIQDEAVE